MKFKKNNLKSTRIMLNQMNGFENYHIIYYENYLP